MEPPRAKAGWKNRSDCGREREREAAAPRQNGIIQPHLQHQAPGCCSCPLPGSSGALRLAHCSPRSPSWSFSRVCRCLWISFTHTLAQYLKVWVDFCYLERFLSSEPRRTQRRTSVPLLFLSPVFYKTPVCPSPPSFYISHIFTRPVHTHNPASHSDQLAASWRRHHEKRTSVARSRRTNCTQWGSRL